MKLPDNLPPLPPRERLREIRNVPLKEGDLAVDCFNPGVFLRVHPQEFGKMANNPAFSYYRDTEAVPTLPQGLPPLPPVPNGFDRWEYRGTRWKGPAGCKYAFWYEGDEAPAPWDVSLGPTMGDACHYIEAVRDQPAESAATGVEARVCEDVLTPFLNVARGIPDNWPGECILRFDQREDGSLFLSYYGVNDASNGITVDQWRKLLNARVGGWQNIETAPKSARAVLIHCAEFRNTYVAENGSGKWRHFGGGNKVAETPTHWMPLPDPPKNC